MKSRMGEQKEHDAFGNKSIFKKTSFKKLC